MRDDETFNGRAWLAYHSLPRDKKKGTPPARSTLEQAHGLSNAQLTKVFNGAGATTATLPRIAAALNVSQDWLITGVGAPPTPTGPVPPRPGTPEALMPRAMAGDPSKAKRRGDLPGWIDAERAARSKEPERYQWSIRGAREARMEEVPRPGQLTADYVLALAALVRAHAGPDETARLEELEINEERSKISRKMPRALRHR